MRALLLLVPLVLVPAQDPEPEPATPLFAAMEVLEDGRVALRKMIRDPEQYPAALEVVARMQVAALEAKLEVPPMAADVPSDARPAFVADYRRGMIDAVRALLDLEEALMAGDADAVKAGFKALRKLENEAHDRFMPDEE